MIIFFEDPSSTLYAVESESILQSEDVSSLIWLFGEATKLDNGEVSGTFIGPRTEMVTPWSTNAVEIAENMGVNQVRRIEKFISASGNDIQYDPMLERIYHHLDQKLFHVNKVPDPVLEVDNIREYNQREGLALSDKEIEYLEEVSKELDRKLTDSEVFGFSQVNSEHCRHKIFNGTFVINDKTMKLSLFELIKKTSKTNHQFLISAYKDNVAFIQGPVMEQFAPVRHDRPDFFIVNDIESVISLKAETHNFPTTVEPFNGAATGSGGEIRDRMAGGKGSLPLAGTAVYMTSYPRVGKSNSWEQATTERSWLYQSPLEILIKASNGASDFGNKFGQPLIAGSVYTFQFEKGDEVLGYDKVIMLAGGIGFGKKKDSLKSTPKPNDPIVLLGGDNYRIGMGGGAVSSVATGEFSNDIELNAIQRSNPEMQKRVANALRAMAEKEDNPIVSVHDHGAGGHLNCLSELVEETGGIIEVDKLPVGDPTLSEKEIIGNESQERMGLIISKDALDELKSIAERERAPFYTIGKATGDGRLTFKGQGKRHPIDWSLHHMFGSSPKTRINDQTVATRYSALQYDTNNFHSYVQQVVELESVGCKDWLTNKVDRSVTGKVAKQQTCGELQLPLNNVGVMALDFKHLKGVATSLGHAPAAGLISSKQGAILSIAEALTNLVWAPLSHGLSGVSLSANWMWPCRNPGEEARLYQAVQGASEFSCDLGINIPTGKDSLSMTQKYPDGTSVKAPGTVIISAVAEVSDIRKVVEPVFRNVENNKILYIDCGDLDFALGGSCFAQTLGFLGEEVPGVSDPNKFTRIFNVIQEAIKHDEIVAGHDVSDGGLITSLFELCFSMTDIAFCVDLTELHTDLIRACFSEQPALVVEVADGRLVERLENYKITFYEIGQVLDGEEVEIAHGDMRTSFNVNDVRSRWFNVSYGMDREQTDEQHASLRKAHLDKFPLIFRFPTTFHGKYPEEHLLNDRLENPKAAIIREKGVNGDREMAYALYMAGFQVKDVHMTDLMSGRETLNEISMIVFVGGFSNSDVLGSAKGWAGAFLFNKPAKEALDNFYSRPDTLSLGVCNGCQLMMELNLLYPDQQAPAHMLPNASGKFESAFVGMKIPENNSVMLAGLAGTEMGIWVAHGEGRFRIPEPGKVNVVGRYAHDKYPANPNGSDHAVAALSSKDGRHLAMMPHLERSLFPWNWAYYPPERNSDEVTPWVEAFSAARSWILSTEK